MKQIYTAPTKEAAKALNRAFKLWKTSKIKRMIKRRNGLDDNRKWFKYTTVLFRMLFNEWRLEDANSIGNDAIQIGLMLLSSSRRETVHSYTPVEDRQFLNIFNIHIGNFFSNIISFIFISRLI